MSDDRQDERMRQTRRLQCGAGRSADFKAGHRLALRAAVAWLHDEAKVMNDPRARDILNMTAAALGAAAGTARSAEDGAAEDPTPGSACSQSANQDPPSRGGAA